MRLIVVAALLIAGCRPAPPPERPPPKSTKTKAMKIAITTQRIQERYLRLSRRTLSMESPTGRTALPAAARTQKDSIFLMAGPRGGRGRRSFHGRPPRDR